MKPSVFRSGCHIRGFNKIIYHCTFVDELTNESQKEPEKAVTSDDKSNCPDTYKSCHQFYQLLRGAITGVISNIKQYKSNSPDEEAPTGGPRDRDKMKHEKEKHTWSLQIVNQLLKLTSEYDSAGGDPREAEVTEEHGDTYPFYNHGEQPGTQSQETKKTETPFLLAVKYGVVEMVEEILKRFPWAIYDTNEEEKNAVLLAAENRQAKVYMLLLASRSLEDMGFSKVDNKGNSALHLAANLVGSNSSWLMLGPVFQMTFESKWYGYVRDSMPVHYFHRSNRNGESPTEVFIKTHRDLLKRGGEWLTKTSESCSVVAALIATVAFATVATVPGGNDQLKGTPLLGNRSSFNVFAIASLFALAFSTSSLINFLAILTSGSLEIDFWTILLRKLLLAITSLYISIGAMLVSFCAAHFFVLNDHLKHVAFLIYALTFLPVSFFAAAQFPLYFDIMRATFMEVSLRSYTVVPDSTQEKPADNNKDKDTATEIIKLLKNLPDSIQKKLADDKNDEKTL